MSANYKVDFDIATNFDKEMIDVLAKYDAFKWVYGKFNNDIVGGGRPSIRLPFISWQELEEYINYCHAHNIKFNYLLNALCLGGKEFNKEFHTSVVELLTKLVEIHIDGVTVASPYLCQIVKSYFPDLFVSISVYNKVDSLNQLEYWKNIGADEVTLDQRVNRDFGKLKVLFAYAKKLDLKLRLIGNNTCLHECPFHGNHAVTHSHGSKSDEKSRVFHLDYQVMNCNLIKIKDPSKIISSDWIRPEDLVYYEQLCEEVGYDKLSIKLTERGRTTPWLIRVLKLMPIDIMMAI
ncbi:U32 family peptidase [Cellulosilyticum ruminicola]|uniref:U32 family peptidase n=1 Tax=Cellulosilyticum ruminicola TaxID=425254 RepID=UPI0006CF3755|nr:U32 family peptidase [Cellulosilyticum ruminicola]